MVDEELARKSPCRCYVIILPNGKKVMMCYSKGIIGTLTKDQIKEYCPEIIKLPAPKKLAERLSKFAEVAAATAGLPLKERLAVISHYLKKRELPPEKKRRAEEIIEKVFPTEFEIRGRIKIVPVETLEE
ncbi:hypothetical protein DRP04_11485 [Archaeoglobales archaeon]|nr:MAG: hypothetical protein DRP04_11485 [Archaeoglobales archaeon]